MVKLIQVVFYFWEGINNVYCVIGDWISTFSERKMLS